MTCEQQGFFFSGLPAGFGIPSAFGEAEYLTACGSRVAGICKAIYKSPISFVAGFAACFAVFSARLSIPRRVLA